MTEQSAAGPAREPSPPTVVQPAGGSPPTVAQPAGASPPTVAQRPGAAGGAEGAGSDDDRFPEELLGRFEPLEMRGMGSEGVVWRVRRKDGEPERFGAVKIYWTGRPIDSELIDHLRSSEAFQRHIPRIGETGRFTTPAGPRHWVELEYLPETLADHIAARQTADGLPVPRQRAMLEELAEVIRFWQDRIERNPLDFKPENLLLRPAKGNATPEVVLADLGGVSAFRASQTIGEAMTTLAYAPPERLWKEKRSPWPWWSLGEIAYELATGVPRFRSVDGTVKSESVLARDRVLGADLSAVADARWRLLIRGLLTQDPDDRWTYTEVRAWLDGGSPPVAGDAPAAQAAEPPRKHGPIAYRGRPFHDPAELARSIAESTGQARKWLAVDGGAARLEEWLTKELRDTDHDHTYLGRIGRDPENAHLAVTAFVAAYAPELPPRYKDRPVDADGLAGVVVGATSGDFTRELAERGVLAVAAQARCAHPACRAGRRCTVLDHAATVVSEAVAQAGRDARSAPGGVALTKAEEGRAYQAAMVVALKPDRASDLLRALGRRPGGGPTSRLTTPKLPSWWRSLQRSALTADPSTTLGVGRIAVAAALAERALRESTQAAPAARSVPWAQRLHLRTWTVEALLVACAAMLLSWTAATIRGVVDLSDSKIALSVAGHYIGLRAADLQYEYLGLDVCAGILAVVLAHHLRTPAPFYIAPVAAGAVAGLRGYVPGFSAFVLPDTARVWLEKIGDFWGEWIVWICIGYFIIAMMICTRVANRARGGAGRWPAGDRQTTLLRSDAPAAPYVAFALLLASFITIAWATEIVRTQTWLGSKFPPEVLPDDQIGHYLFLLLVLAAIGVMAAKQGGAWLAVLSAVVVVGAVWPQPQLPGVLGSAMLSGVIDWFDTLCGGNVLWAALALTAISFCVWMPMVRAVRAVRR